MSDTEYIDLPAMGLKAWLYGHWHVNHVHKHKVTGVYTICTSTPACGGIDHAPSAFRVLTVDTEGNVASEFLHYILFRWRMDSCQHFLPERFLCPSMPTLRFPQYEPCVIGVNRKVKKFFPPIF